MPDIRRIEYDFDYVPTLDRPGWTNKPPVINGWWFFAPNHYDWDISRPCSVQRIEDYTGIRHEVKLPVGEYNPHNCWINVMDERLRGFVWYGPLRVPYPPRAEGSF